MLAVLSRPWAKWAERTDWRASASLTVASRTLLQLAEHVGTASAPQLAGEAIEGQDHDVAMVEVLEGRLLREVQPHPMDEVEILFGETRVVHAQGERVASPV